KKIISFGDIYKLANWLHCCDDYRMVWNHWARTKIFSDWIFVMLCELHCNFKCESILFLWNRNERFGEWSRSEKLKSVNWNSHHCDHGLEFNISHLWTTSETS